jgi:hypothetical protein
LKEGDYDAYLYFSGTSTLVMGPASFHVSNGDIISWVLLDDESGNLELLPVSDASE